MLCGLINNNIFLSKIRSVEFFKTWKTIKKWSEKKKRSTNRRIRKDKSLFSPEEGNTFEKFSLTTVIIGFATDMGNVINSWFVKAFGQTVDEKTYCILCVKVNVS